MIAVSAGRVIVDRTALTGLNEFTLSYRPETGRPTEPNDDRPNVFTALTEQLGLKLEPTRGPVEVRSSTEWNGRRRADANHSADG